MQYPNGTMSVRQLASYLGVGLSVAYQIVKSEGFPALKIGEKRIVIPIEQLNEWLKNNAGKPIV